MYLHTPTLELGSWWRVDTASGTDTPTTVYAHDGTTDPIGTSTAGTGSTVRATTFEGTALFWSTAATLYCKQVTYKGVPTGPVVTSVGIIPAAPSSAPPVDLTAVLTAVSTGYAPLPTVPRTSANPLTGFFHVDSFGAVGDGVTSDTAAIQAAIDAANVAGGGVVQLAAKTYCCNVTLKTGVRIVGQGRRPGGSQISRLRPAALGPVISLSAAATTSVGGVEDLVIQGNPSDATNHGIYAPRGAGTSSSLSGSYDMTFRRLQIESCGGWGLYLQAGDAYQCHQFNTFDQLHIRLNKAGGVYGTGRVQNNLWQQVHCEYNTGPGVYFQNYLTGGAHYYPDNNTLVRCIFEQNSNGGTCHGVFDEGANNTYFSCWWEANGGDDPGKASAALYFNTPRADKTNHRVLACHIATHFIDIWCFQGQRNQIEYCYFDWNAVTPAPADKGAAIRVEVNATRTFIGHNNFNDNYRNNGAPRLQTGDASSYRFSGEMVQAPGGIILPVKAGTPASTDFSQTFFSNLPQGAVSYDITNHRIYVTDGGGVWARSVPLDIEPPWTVDLAVYNTAYAQNGWDTLTVDSACIHGGYKATDSNAATTNSISFQPVLAAGTWTLRLLYVGNADAGIMTVSLDAVSIGTVDGYAASITQNQRAAIAGFTVGKGGRHDVTITAPTKNASSSGYGGYLQAITLQRTA